MLLRPKTDARNHSETVASIEKVRDDIEHIRHWRPFRLRLPLEFRRAPRHRCAVNGAGPRHVALRPILQAGQTSLGGLRGLLWPLSGHTRRTCEAIAGSSDGGI